VTPEQFCYWLQGYFENAADCVDTGLVEEKLQSVLERKELEQTTVWSTKAHRDHAEILKEYVK
jgi:hypothetical protein